MTSDTRGRPLHSSAVFFWFGLFLFLCISRPCGIALRPSNYSNASALFPGIMSLLYFFVSMDKDLFFLAVTELRKWGNSTYPKGPRKLFPHSHLVDLCITSIYQPLTPYLAETWKYPHGSGTHAAVFGFVRFKTLRNSTNNLYESAEKANWHDQRFPICLSCLGNIIYCMKYE